MRLLATLLLSLAFLPAGVHTPAAASDAAARANATAQHASRIAERQALAVAGSFIALCYHEVRDDVRDYPDPYAVDSSALVGQFAWLRGNGYVPVSLQQIVSARQGGKPLPPKAVLLSFDDAYLSFYTRVYPLLREFGFPALLGVVGTWIDNPGGTQVLYGEKDTGTVPEASFPTWAQLREMAGSGLIELASHSYDLHRGVPANPQGNLQPAATTRIWDAVNARYEGDAAWRERVRADLARNSAAIERGTGQKPRAVVWPYGSYNGELVRIAGELGMPITLTLEDGANTPQVPLSAMRRVLIGENPNLADFAAEVRGARYPDIVRVVRVDIGSLRGADPAEEQKNLSALIDRIDALRPSHVHLTATADTNGDGIDDAAYFPNRHLPLHADLFNRVAWQLKTRAGVKVFAVLPVNGLRLPQEIVAELYEDLARHASFEGLVFEDGSIGQARALADRARAFRTPLATVGMPPSAADIPAFAAAHDHVALRDMPAGGEAWSPEVRPKIVYILPRSGALRGQMRQLQLGGAINYGYSGDDFMRDDPPLAEMVPAMSLRRYPLPQKTRDN